MKKFPFKFLDAYTKEDKDIFFGREQELDELYRMVFQTNLLLVYGPSGTGKTSLIRCGLANRFKPSQWLDLYIRRGADINQSLLETVRKSIPKTAPVAAEEAGEEDWFETLVEAEQEAGGAAVQAPALESDNPVAQALQELYLATFTPIYLIFDQFEEIYTLGEKQEQQRLTQTLRELAQLPLPLKILIVMREEYLARLYELELAVPQLRTKKLRIEPMDLPRVEGIILRATDHDLGEPAPNLQSNITLEAGKEKAIAKMVIEKIREGDVNVQLPYLQVFMDRLYESATGEEVDRTRETTFTLDLVNSLGTIGDELAGFLERQSRRIHHKLVEKYPGLPADIVWRLLSPFATVGGTKAPIRESDLEKIGQAFSLATDQRKEDFLKDAIAELEASRILRYRKEEGTYELAHDALARQVAEKRSEEEKAFLKAKRIVNDGYASYQDTGTLLSREQLAFVRPFEERLKEKEELNENQKKFLSDSKSRRLRQRIYLWAGVAAAFAVAIGVTLTVIGEQRKTADALTLAEQREAEAKNAQQETAEALQLAEQREAEAVLQKEKADSSALVAEQKSEEAGVNARLAEQRSAEARAALDNLQRSNASVVDLILKNANRDILNLRYEDALAKIKAAAGLGARQDSVARVYLELAFWHNEAGNFNRTLGILDSAATLVGKGALVPKRPQLPGDTTAAREELRAVIRKWDSTAYKSLRERYYPVMVKIPGGAFTMGCDPEIDPDCDINEDQHEVAVSDYYLARYETTWWQYYLFCQATGHGYESPGWGTEGDNPVVNVCWYDAVDYANWVSGQQQLERAIGQDDGGDYQVDLSAPDYRLPTEAEWEYAAKGGIPKQAFIYSGSNDLDSVGWSYENSKSRTQAVGKKKANRLGLHDMSGNVGEWVDQSEGADRVQRGGGWFINAGYCRVSYRNSGDPADRYDGLGFRLALPLQ